MTRTARIRYGREQTPVRIVRLGALGVPVVVATRTVESPEVLSDMAEQLASSMHERQFNRVGVLEFKANTTTGEAAGCELRDAGRYCASELEQRLMARAAGEFGVVDSQRLMTALKSQDFTVKELGSTSALKNSPNRAGGMPAIAVGALRSRRGRVVTLQCRLLQTDDDNTLAGIAAGTAYLNESEWAMLGISVEIRDEDELIDVEPPPQPATSPDEESPIAPVDAIIQHADQQAKGPHPLADPEFPYRVKIMVGGRERTGVFDGNDMYVPLNKGEQFEIWIENRSGKLTLMRLLVDGLNTLPEKESTRGVQTLLVAHRVNLADARHWVLDPSVSNRYAVRGFFTSVETAAKYRAFKVVDAGQSLASRQKFTDQLGIITAAFYRPQAARRGGGIGIGFGDEGEETVRTRKVANRRPAGRGPYPIRGAGSTRAYSERRGTLNDRARFCDAPRSCHSERSEESPFATEILRCAQDDSSSNGVAESRTVI